MSNGMDCGQNMLKLSIIKNDIFVNFNMFYRNLCFTKVLAVF